MLILGYITRNRVELTEITQQIFSHSKQFLHSLAPKTPNIYKITAEIGPSGRITSRSFDVWVNTTDNITPVVLLSGKRL